MLSSLAHRNNLRIVLCTFAAVFVAALTMLLLIRTVNNAWTDRGELTSDTHTPFRLTEISPEIVLTSFLHREDYSVDPKGRILLIPHHLVAGREIASLLASSPVYSEALLLSPDHFSQGKQALSTTGKVFEWNEERIVPNNHLINRLQEQLGTTVGIQDNVFVREHGVRGLLPFLHTAWPHTTITPITVRTDTADQTVLKLAQTLHTELTNNPNLMIVFTIDFSHELPAYLADLHDKQAMALLEALDTNTAHKRVEIDSPPLFLLLTTLLKQQHSTPQLQAHTNSLRLMQATVTKLSTSHVLLSEATASVPNVSPTSSHFTFFHDPTHPILSSEDRVYRGYDAVRTTKIPFPTAFIKEEHGTLTRWHAIPLEPLASKQWQVVSDQQFSILETNRANWEEWAKTHLSDTDGE